MAFDNLSAFSNSDMDQFCQIVTGAGFGKRKNWSDLDEIIISVTRPLLLTSTANLLTRPDFASRAIAIVLPSIRDEDRLTETEFWASFNAAAPGILACLLDGAVMALKCFGTVKLPRLPRMADFAKIACAAAPAFGWTPMEMLEALERNGRSVVAGLIEEDLVAEAVLKLATEISPKVWHGSPTELLAVLNKTAPDDIRREHSWPKAADKLSGRLKHIEGALRHLGVRIEHGRDANKRWIKIGKIQTAPKKVKLVIKSLAHKGK